SLKSCIRILLHALPQAKVNAFILDDPKYQYLFSVEAVNALVQEGHSFRDAYRQVGLAIEQGNFQAPEFAPQTHTLTGSLGSLATEPIRKEWRNVMEKF